MRDRIRETIVALRKQNLSIYDISRTLAAQRTRRSPVAVSVIVKAEGLAKLPGAHTQFGGLFLFVPFLAQIPLERILAHPDSRVQR